MPSGWINIETRAGAPIQIGEMRLVPLAQSVRIQPRGVPVGLIWNRPTSVIAQTPDGAQHTLTVWDVTRQLQIRLLAAGLIGSLLIWLLFRRFD